MASRHIKTFTVLNVDKSTSTAISSELPFKESVAADTYIVSDVDEELLILVEFKGIINLDSVKIYALSQDNNDDLEESSGPKDVHIYNIKNLNVNFNDIKSIKSDKSFICSSKKLIKGQKLNLKKNTFKFNKTQYLAIYISSNQNETETTFINGIVFKGDIVTMDDNKNMVIEPWNEHVVQLKGKQKPALFHGWQSDVDESAIKQWMNKKGYKISDEAITRMKNDGFNEVEIKALIRKKNKSELEAKGGSGGMMEFIEHQMNEKEIDYNIKWKELLVFGFWRQITDWNRRISLDVVETIVNFFGFLVEIDSVVLTNDEKDILTKILMQNVIKKMKKQQNIRLNLIYRQSKETEPFHSFCCDKSPLVFVFHSKFNHICGVFQSIPLKNHGGWKYDEHCFLFLLRSSFGHKPNVWKVTKDKNDVISRYNVVRDGMGMNYPSWGASGMGCALSVYKSDSFSMNSKTFEYENGNALLGGSKYSNIYTDHRAGKVEEYEVYQIIIS